MIGSSENVGSISYDARIDTKKLHSDAKDVESIVGRAGDKLGHGLAAAGKAAAVGIGLASVAAVGFGALSVKAFNESELAIAQTNAVLKSTGGAAGVTAETVSQLASSLQSQTRYSDESIRSAENMLLTFTKIGKDTFPTATEAVLDMSTAMGTDLQSTAIQVGKALQDPVRGVTALQRVGVRLSDSQKDLVEKLVKTGDVAGAQTIILKELQTEFGGSAKAAGKTFAGQLDILKNRFNDIQETIGKVIVTALIPLVAKIGDFLMKIDWEDVIYKSVQVIKTLATTLINVYTAISTYLGPGIVRFISIIRQLWNWLYGMLAPSIVNLANTFKDRLLPQLIAIWNTIEPGFTTALKVLAVVIGVAIVAAIWLFINVLNVVSSALGFVIRVVTDVINWIGNFIGATVNAVKEVGGWFGRLPGYVGDAIGAVIQWFKDLPGKILEAMGDVGSILLNAGKDLIQGFVDGVKNKFNDVKDTLGNLTSKLVSWKGPLSLDKIILEKSGKAVIDGFIKGLESQYKNVQSSLGGLTGGLSGNVNLAGMSSINSIDNTGRPDGQSGVNVVVNLSGVMSRSKSDERDIAKSLVRVLNDELTAKHLEPIGGGAFR